MPWFVRLGIACLWWCIAGSTLAAQLPLQDYFIDRWSTRDGLPHNSINSMAQTRDGYLWFATWEGLARYNGRTFRYFERGRETGLPDSGLRALRSETDGNLIVAGARGGLSNVRHGHWLAYAPAEAMINDVLRAPDGSLWLALEGRGLVRRPGLDLQTRDYDQTLIPDISVSRLLRMPGGGIWAATSEGLYRVSPARLLAPQHMAKAVGLPDRPMYALLRTSSNQLIVGGVGGVWRRQGERFVSLHPDLSSMTVTRLLEDRQGDLWIGTMRHGVMRLSKGHLEYLNVYDALMNSRVLSLLEDREGSIWVGTNGGLARFRAAPFTSWTRRQRIAGDYVRSVLGQADGSVWLGTSNGLSHLIGHQVRSWHQEEQSGPSILSLMNGPQHSLLVGTYTQGVLRWQNGAFTPFLSRKQGLASNEVRVMLADNQQPDGIWIGTTRGLQYWQGDQLKKTYTLADGLPSNFVMALAWDLLGRLWVGTAQGVVIMTPGGDLHALDLSGKDHAEYAFGFYLESDYAWIASDRGLIRYRMSDGQLGLIGRRAGLPVDKIFQVVRDTSEGFWLSSNRGIIHVDYDQAMAVADGQKQRLEVERYGERDGMTSSQANGGSNPAATLTPDGRVWFATASGVVSVQPQMLSRFGETRLPVVIEDIAVEGVSQGWVQGIQLPPNERRISFSYAGLGYVMPQRIEYRTWLEGFDRNWVDRGTQNIAEYTNLAPGHYTFRVSARYPYGQWHDTEARVNFTIRPYLWERRSVQVLTGLLILLMFVAFWRWRVRQLEHNAVLLREQVARQTHALREQAEAFEQQAREDQLTGLPNRRAFDEELEGCFQESLNAQKALALAIIDIDHFKRINDQWSHLVGDRAICAVADVLRRVAPPSCRVARWGGEEFTLMFPDMTMMQARAYCDQLRVALEKGPHPSLPRDLWITASFGVSDSLAAPSYERLLAQADTALYEAKNKGRNRVELWRPAMAAVQK